MWGAICKVSQIISALGAVALFTAVLAARMRHIKMSGNRAVRKVAVACCVAVIVGWFISSWAGFMAGYTADAEATVQIINEELRSGEPAGPLTLGDILAIPFFIIFLNTAYIIFYITDDDQ